MYIHIYTWMRRACRLIVRVVISAAASPINQPMVFVSVFYLIPAPGIIVSGENATVLRSCACVYLIFHAVRGRDGKL